jgi:hypothetical protein
MGNGQFLGNPSQFSIHVNLTIGFLSWPNPSRGTMALWSTQPLTEISTKNLPGGKRRPAPKADNLTAICERIV